MRSFFSTVNSKAKIVRIWDAIAQPKAQKVSLTTRRENIITWYACGPTVYDSAHIGHASSYIRIDTIRRILERQNYTVLQVMGITDIDDKIINKANHLGVPWESVSRKYEAEFSQELKEFNILPPLVRARVTNFIPQIVSFIDNLISSGYAYTTSDCSVYFDTKAFGHSGVFHVGNDDPYIRPDLAKSTQLKKNKSDFALWKGAKLNEPFWTSPWGNGRPGWHIECSVIATHYFGRYPLDIHSGGSDLTFPHHQCEEIQCCAHLGLKKWVTHWIHTGFLTPMERDNDNENGVVKMSKSLGNTLTIQDFLKDNSPNILRMLCLYHNTRSDIYYTPGATEKAKLTLRRFESFIIECDTILQGHKVVTCESDTAQHLWQQIPSIQTRVEDALCDDFDTPKAIDIVDEFISDFNRRFEFSQSNKSVTKGDDSPIDFQLVLACKSLISEFVNLLGFNLEYQRAESRGAMASQIFHPMIQEFVEFRQRVRCYSLALDEADKKRRKEIIQERQSLIQACDQVRNNLGHYGINLTDHGKNTSWSMK